MGKKQKEKRLAEYEEKLKQKKLAKSTKDIYFREAKRFEAFIETGGMDQRTIGEYVHCLKSAYRIGTVNLYVIALNVYLKYLGREDLTVKQEHISHRRNLENVISMEEYRNILSYTAKKGDRKHNLLIRTLASTGIRVSELQFITVERLSFGYINVYNKGRAREIYLPDFLLEELKEYCRRQKLSHGAVFRGSTGKPISRIAVWQMLQKIAGELSISKEKAHPHGLRHLFAKSYMNKYDNLFELADILGHSSVETTRIYTVSTVEEKRGRMERLGM